MFDLPLEYALIKFEDAKPTGKIVPELLDLAQRGIVRFIYCQRSQSRIFEGLEVERQ